ncbi:hypothetical protein CCR75_006709 [Bremia lactucae]|uniref:Holocytochrome c-type synthase n=1 Tax=Bremia lactucae TaxID=4779 RepID=A0A976IBH3_BRELC|nr:hypothetical protein CCR75_006709 [Bremia lactucae]
MGSQVSKDNGSDTATNLHQSESLVQHESKSKQNECPVQHENVEKIQGCPVQHDKKLSIADAMGGGCPVVREGKDDNEVFDVYGQRIDPTNMMPYNPNQDPIAEQRYPLPKNRVQSTIPKGGTESTWLYPSEQMFFNALKRKGKGEDVHEGDVRAIVSIHNNMNERAWAQVEHFEKVCHPELESVKLLKFCGRPDKLTPIAWVKSMLGFGKPFDRHDWTVLRSDNTQVRYVIDYYFDNEKTALDQVPELHSEDKVKSISMYARPAVDSVGALMDRVKFPFASLFNGLEGPNLTARSALIEQAEVERDALEPLSVEEVKQTFAQVKDSCKGCLEKVKTCSSDVQCSQAALALQVCMGQIICPEQVDTFTKALEKGDNVAVVSAFDALNSKLEKFQERGSNAMQEQAVRESLAMK